MSAEIASFEKVKGSVLYLRANGIAATADRVITHLGGGGKATVLRHLKTLRDGDAPEETLPPAVIDMARSALAEVYAAGGKAEAERSAAGLAHLTTSMRELDAQVEELAGENIALRQTIEDLQSEQEAILVAAEGIKSTLAQTTRELQTTKSELSVERGANAEKIATLMIRLEARVASISTTDGGATNETLRGS